MAETAATGALALAPGDDRPYPPGWYDRVTARIEQLPLPAWLTYLLAYLLLLSGYTAFKWTSGTYPVGTFFPFHSIVPTAGLLTFAAAHFLDGVAARAMAAFRPALLADDAGYRDICYRLTTLPARETMIATVLTLPLAVLGVVAALVGNNAGLGLLRIGATPLEFVVDAFFSLADWLGGTIFVYHAIHQLGLVRHILSHRASVSLFGQAPLHSFSTLTALTAATITLGMVVMFISLPELLSLPGMLIITPLSALFACFVFVTPLLGVHHALLNEKRQRQIEVGRRLDGALAVLHRRMDSGELAGISDLQAGIDSLVKERDILESISTWPWSADTLRLTLSTLLLPVVLLVVQRLIDFFWHI